MIAPPFSILPWPQAKHRFAPLLRSLVELVTQFFTQTPHARTLPRAGERFSSCVAISPASRF